MSRAASIFRYDLCTYTFTLMHYNSARLDKDRNLCKIAIQDRRKSFPYLCLADGRCRFERDVNDDVLAIADSALNSSGTVRLRPGSSG